MRLYFKFILIYLILNNKWILVESTDTSATPPASSGGDGTSSGGGTGQSSDGSGATHTGGESKDGQGGGTTPPANEGSGTNLTSGSGSPGTSNLKPTSVNIYYQQETDTYKSELNGNIRTFTPKDGFAFNSAHDFIIGAKIEFWKTKNVNEYSKKIDNEGGNKVTIYIGEGTSASTKVFKKADDKWTEVTASSKKGSDTGTKTGVELSIKVTDGTNEFDFNKDGQVVTFTAKDGFGFSLVKTRTGCCSCTGSDLTIWDANDDKEYGSKVVLDGKGQNKKEVTIHQPDGTKKVFKRDGKGKPWTDVNQHNNQATGQPASSQQAPSATS